jgi:glycine cleavage system H protein
MATPTDRRYAKTHEWVKVDGNIATIGITDHAQDALGDITFIELPKPGTKLTRDKELGVVESVKASSDLYSPVSGEVIAANAALSTQPDIVNKDPYNTGWMITVKVADGPDQTGLMDAAGYDTFAQ